MMDLNLKPINLTNNNVMTLDELCKLCSLRLKNIYTQYADNIPAPELKNAIDYSLLNNGKYLRPLLIYATGYAFAAPWENLDIPAATVELIHTYSLIHDDLPCMDNADLRRGKPTCHKIYGDGMAVLTGDALHTLAIYLMASHPAPLTAEKRVQMMTALTHACGPHGMAAGQALDILPAGAQTMSIDYLEKMYRLKTGALLSACIELGRLSSANEDSHTQHALKIFGDCIGLAFQIQDDILDIETATEILGKPQAIDDKNNKCTYPQLIGLEKAKEKVQSLYHQALTAIQALDQHANLLRELTERMLKRDR